MCFLQMLHISGDGWMKSMKVRNLQKEHRRYLRKREKEYVPKIYPEQRMCVAHSRADGQLQRDTFHLRIMRILAERFVLHRKFL